MEHFEALYPADSRSKEIEQILNFIKQGNSVQLIALPGVGRSNLLGLLSYNHNVRVKHLGENQKWFHFVTLNFSEIRKKPLLDATKFLFLGLVESLRDRKFEEFEKANEIFKESVGMNDEMVMFNGLKRTIDYLAIEKQLTIVFLFDRFEEYVPMLTNDFFANLRVLRNRAKYRFSVVFSLNRPLEQLIEPMLFADYYEFLAGHNVFMDIQDKPGLDFRISYLEKASNCKFDKKTIDGVLELTNGHGKLTRLSLEAMGKIEVKFRNRGSTPGRVEPPLGPEEFNRLLEFLLEQKSVRGALFEIWNALTPAEQKLLINLIQNKEFAKESEEFKFLTNIYLLKDGKVNIPLFENTVKERLAKGDTQEIITIDEQTKEIKKDDLILSDQLTKAEYRLLKFLILNPDKILDREEIINAVWQDTVSTIGVTDQALDQLIFRLRNKIEDNPNNPIHIQTIKGRGFKFTP